jgi:ATP-dependent DNA helicase RecG
LYFPYRYDDFSYQPAIAKLRHDDTVTVTGRIRTIKNRPSKNRRLILTEAILEDESGGVKVMWFNQPYLTEALKAGQAASLAGRVDDRFGRTLMNPIYEPPGLGIHTGRIVPIYGLSASLTMRRLRSAIKTALQAAEEFSEWLPGEILRDESFPSLAQAIRAIHFPESKAELHHAVERLKFDELFLHQLLFAHVRRTREKKSAVAFPVDEGYLKIFVGHLPFTLTKAQRLAAWEIIQDLTKPHPMNRLLEGDVGSGKTVVAAIAIAHTLHQGAGIAYLAPTEILAGQQQRALQKFVADAPIGLLTASGARIGEKDVERSELLTALKTGGVRGVVGTHALLEEGIIIPRLSLVVIDEQHRFGVEQRRSLLERGGGTAPHLLSMTATPIPRSLALSLYGDLELSVLNERPANRKPIATTLVEEKGKRAMWQQLLREISAGRRAYIVCPLIDPSDRLGSKAVTDVVESLRKGALRNVSLAVLHGKMPSDEKAEVLEKFRAGECAALVSTTVVEVGVDVPEATVMVVLGAERFGLAQLHQLRGRVGRSDFASRCFLVPDELNPRARERLQALVGSQDGFAIAEKDLALRGPGNLFGNAQAGFPDFKLATVADVPLMKKARDHAARLLTSDPDLEAHTAIHEEMRRSVEQAHLE